MPTLVFTVMRCSELLLAVLFFRELVPTRNVCVSSLSMLSSVDGVFSEVMHRVGAWNAWDALVELNIIFWAF